MFGRTTSETDARTNVPFHRGSVRSDETNAAFQQHPSLYDMTDLSGRIKEI